ncbi:hypothetical protein [Bosea sp. PAMC 26642]|uniref:hypothetical protein n=1 Tax=Bosea sp. (strain PAMC 26642) TaxID=1792307 RepID=UPI0012E92BBB|nr:hypothetical protein [Bosea sp. PAMC 26642]
MNATATTKGTRPRVGLGGLQRQPFAQNTDSSHINDPFSGEALGEPPERARFELILTIPVGKAAERFQIKKFWRGIAAGNPPRHVSVKQAVAGPEETTILGWTR